MNVTMIYVQHHDDHMTCSQYVARFPGKFGSRKLVRTSYVPVLPDGESFPDFLRRWAALLDVGAEGIDMLPRSGPASPSGDHRGAV